MQGHAAQSFKVETLLNGFNRKMPLISLLLINFDSQRLSCNHLSQNNLSVTYFTSNLQTTPVLPPAGRSPAREKETDRGYSPIKLTRARCQLWNILLVY